MHLVKYFKHKCTICHMVLFCDICLLICKHVSAQKKNNKGYEWCLICILIILGNYPYTLYITLEFRPQWFENMYYVHVDDFSLYICVVYYIMYVFPLEDNSFKSDTVSAPDIKLNFQGHLSLFKSNCLSLTLDFNVPTFISEKLLLFISKDTKASISFGLLRQMEHKKVIFLF